ncbi:MAG: hypothetical protein AB7R89_31430 [Dehalococcoidia bacterium]
MDKSFRSVVRFERRQTDPVERDQAAAERMPADDAEASQVEQQEAAAQSQAADPPSDAPS